MNKKCFFGRHETYIARKFRNVYDGCHEIDKIKCLNCSKEWGFLYYGGGYKRKWGHDKFITARTIEFTEALRSVRYVDDILKKVCKHD